MKRIKKNEKRFIQLPTKMIYLTVMKLQKKFVSIIRREKIKRKNNDSAQKTFAFMKGEDKRRTMKDNKKVKVSKNEFAEVLYFWLSKFLNKDALKKKADEFGFKIRSEEGLGKILGVLAPFDMWLTVYTCERVFKNEKKRNDCLDIFHHLVYTKSSEEAEKDFGKWMNYMGEKYIEYDQAMKTEHPSTPLWPVATLVNKDLFGEIKEDVWIQMRIVTYIGLFVKHLEDALRQYDVE